MELTVGGLTRQATVRANSVRVGVQGLGFEYVVQANDQDADGISIAANAIRLNGGTITATDGTTAAVLTHPAVPDDPSRKVGDGTTEPPITTSLGVSSIYFGSSPANGDTYQRGETIDVRVLFTGRVLAGGSPRLALTIGNQTRVAQYYGNRPPRHRERCRPPGRRGPAGYHPAGGQRRRRLLHAPEGLHLRARRNHRRRGPVHRAGDRDRCAAAE